MGVAKEAQLCGEGNGVTSQCLFFFVSASELQEAFPDAERGHFEFAEQITVRGRGRRAVLILGRCTLRFGLVGVAFKLTYARLGFVVELLVLIFRL